MVAAVRVHKPGGPEALTYEDVQIAAPGQGQIKIKQHACGVNFIDAYFRMGMYPSPVGLPFIAAALAYFFALLVIHILSPRLTPAVIDGEAAPVA